MGEEKGILYDALDITVQREREREKKKDKLTTTKNTPPMYLK